MAFGFRAAFRRALRAIWASCSGVVPYRSMWAWANGATQDAAEAEPKGSVHCWNRRA